MGRREAPDPAGMSRGCGSSAEERGTPVFGDPSPQGWEVPSGGVSGRHRPGWQGQGEGGLAGAGSSRRCRGPPRAAPPASAAGCWSSPGDRG